jgi:hypothetical protein
VSRAIVAIHAVHHPNHVGGRLALEFFCPKHSRLSRFQISDARPRDFLSFLVGRVVLDLFVLVDVPVNAAERTAW